MAPQGKYLWKHLCLASARYSKYFWNGTSSYSPDIIWAGSKVKSEWLLANISCEVEKGLCIHKGFDKSQRKVQPSRHHAVCCVGSRGRNPSTVTHRFCVLLQSRMPRNLLDISSLVFYICLILPHEVDRPHVQNPRHNKGGRMTWERSQSSRRSKFQTEVGSLLLECVLWRGREQQTSPAALSWISGTFGQHRYTKGEAEREEKSQVQERQLRAVEKKLWILLFWRSQYLSLGPCHSFLTK